MHSPAAHLASELASTAVTMNSCSKLANSPSCAHMPPSGVRWCQTVDMTRQVAVAPLDLYSSDR